jgi:lycopene beta-cyclase
MKTEADLIILGGGCAGLSLAWRLAESPNTCPHTLILESRTHYTHDRTWCFWGDASSPMRHLVSHQWSRVLVATGTREVIANCSSTPYQMIPAGAFYEAATAAIAKRPKIALSMNETIVSELTKEGDQWRIETNHGTRWAKSVVDTRPARKPTRGGAVLWQSFAGQEIECEAECFDPATVRLMDFSQTCGTPPTFQYLLPLSRNRALIEVTVFAKDPLNEEDLVESRDALIRKAVRGSRHSVLRSEHGLLPMGQSVPKPCPDRSRVQAGVAAGGARPSTGFAFQRIQSWAAGCAASLTTGGSPLPHPKDPWSVRVMDRLFLNVLCARPELAPELFAALFAMKEPGRMIRFLSDLATWVDCAAMIRALPAAPFLQELVRGLNPARSENREVRI